MGELRKDYILDRFVIIASKRGKRPHEFKIEKEEPLPEIDYFGPGNENLTPPEIYRWPEDSGDWNIRVFPNKFAAVHSEGNYEIKTDNKFFTYSDSYGNHEVIVETPDIYKSLVDLSVQEISQVFKIFNRRIIENLKNPKIKYVSVFKNHGKDAGTSIRHTHCQLIAYNIVPQEVIDKEKALEKYGLDSYENIINIEKNSDRRCFENHTMVAFAPYASRFPFEVCIFPKRNLIRLEELTEEEYLDIADLLRKVLLKLKELNADYNFFLHYGIKNMRLHLTVCPRLSKWAGFEHATGTIINTMSPEDAAEFYRS
jgi:UDPglucose--hexose-1-phosphate uridylyltransferase